MREFKKGAFRFAMDLGLPLLPVTILGTRNILPKGPSDLFPGTARMIIHPPVSTEEYTKETMQELMDKARAVIQSGMPSEKES